MSSFYANQVNLIPKRSKASPHAQATFFNVKSLKPNHAILTGLLYWIGLDEQIKYEIGENQGQGNS